jgi:DNA-binding NarL/FixJ family response regulator
MLKLAIVDDNVFLQKAVLEKIAFFPDTKVKFTAENGQDLLDKLKADHNVDVILMDIEMPIMDGIEATSAVKARYPHIKIIMLTVFDNDENIFNAIKAGADGYLLKEVNPKDLLDAVTETISGGAGMTPSIALKTLRLLRNPIDFSKRNNETDVKLSQREIEVLEQLSKGLKYALIADNLFLSVGTIKKHIENIYTKLQVHNKLEAIQKAKDNNLI